MSKSILIIGASGRLGLAIIREASKHASHPSIHAFVRTPSKIPSLESGICSTIQKGDALKPQDIHRALKATLPDTVIITIGVPDSTAPTHVREESGRSLFTAIKEGPPVRVVCVSSIGAGGSAINVGFGIGAAIRLRLRHLLKDHDAQEELVWEGIGDERSRALVIRPTGLVDDKPMGRVVMFGDQERSPSVSIGREQVAEFIVDQICGDGNLFGKTVNITSVAEQNGQWGIKALLTLL